MSDDGAIGIWWSRGHTQGGRRSADCAAETVWLLLYVSTHCLVCRSWTVRERDQREKSDQAAARSTRQRADFLSDMKLVNAVIMLYDTSDKKGRPVRLYGRTRRQYAVPSPVPRKVEKDRENLKWARPRRRPLTSTSAREAHEAPNRRTSGRMTSRDVRDIMQLGPAPTASSSSLLQPAPSSRRGGGPPGPPAKRLDGITRELYALIGDNQPALALAQPVKPKFKERTKAVRRPAHWSRIGFTNPARAAALSGDADAETQARRKLVLRHWVKDLTSTLVDGAPDNKFAKFNTSSQPYSYNDAEYDAWLKGPYRVACTRLIAGRDLLDLLQSTTGPSQRRTTSFRSLASTTCASSSWQTVGNSRKSAASTCVLELRSRQPRSR